MGDNLVPFLFSRTSKSCAFTPLGYTSDHPQPIPLGIVPAPRTSDHFNPSYQDSSMPHENFYQLFLIPAGKPFGVAYTHTEAFVIHNPENPGIFPDCSWISQVLFQTLWLSHSKQTSTNGFPNASHTSSSHSLTNYLQEVHSCAIPAGTRSPGHTNHHLRSLAQLQKHHSHPNIQPERPLLQGCNFLPSKLSLSELSLNQFWLFPQRRHSSPQPLSAG